MSQCCLQETDSVLMCGPQLSTMLQELPECRVKWSITSFLQDPRHLLIWPNIFPRAGDCGRLNPPLLCFISSRTGGREQRREQGALGKERRRAERPPRSPTTLSPQHRVAGSLSDKHFGLFVCRAQFAPRAGLEEPGLEGSDCLE